MRMRLKVCSRRNPVSLLSSRNAARIRLECAPATHGAGRSRHRVGHLIIVAPRRRFCAHLGC